MNHPSASAFFGPTLTDGRSTTLKILGTLDPECVVVEFHGPVYHSVHNPNWSLGRHAEGGEDRLAAVHPDLLDQQPHQRLAGGRIAIGVEEADDVGADVVEGDVAGGRLVLHRGHQFSRRRRRPPTSVTRVPQTASGRVPASKAFKRPGLLPRPWASTSTFCSLNLRGAMASNRHARADRLTVRSTPDPAPQAHLRAGGSVGGSAGAPPGRPNRPRAWGQCGQPGPRLRGGCPRAAGRHFPQARHYPPKTKVTQG